MTELQKQAQELGKAIYEKTSAQSGQGAEGGEAGEQAGESAAGDEDVIDAEYEVKE